MKLVEIVCAYCKGAAFAQPNDVRRGLGRFCSIACANRSRTQPKRPRAARPKRPARIRPTLEDRFWAKVDKSNPGGCWVWTAATSWKGYGKFSTTHKTFEASHRLAWILTNGLIPDGLHVCHRCDNPPCCRPDHLFLGTALDNHRDMVLKGRSVSPQNIIDDDEAIAVGLAYAGGETYVSIAGRYNVERKTIVATIRRLIGRSVASTDGTLPQIPSATGPPDTAS